MPVVACLSVLQGLTSMLRFFSRTPITGGRLILLSRRQCYSLQAYDQHLNMILGQVEETVTTVEIDDETYEEIVKVASSLGLATLQFLARHVWWPGVRQSDYRYLCVTLHNAMAIMLRYCCMFDAGLLCRPIRGLCPTSSCGETVLSLCLRPSGNRGMYGG
jgi:hypothetical protein